MALKHEIGRRIREARVRAKLSQGDLAKGAGCTRASLSHIETGSKATNLDLLERIARELGLEPWQLLTDRAASHAPDDCVASVRRHLDGAKSERERAERFAAILLAIQGRKS